MKQWLNIYQVCADCKKLNAVLILLLKLTYMVRLQRRRFEPLEAYPWPCFSRIIYTAVKIYNLSLKLAKKIYTFWEIPNSSQLQASLHELSMVCPVRHCWYPKKFLLADIGAVSKASRMLWGVSYLNLNLISCEWNRGWKLSESTPLFQRRIRLAAISKGTSKFRLTKWDINKESQPTA